MADLTTSYLGLTLKSPIFVSSNPLTYDVNNIRRMEEAGAGAVVLYSLFEEQIELAEIGYSNYYEQHRDELPEALRHVAEMKEYNQGAGSYLAHLYQVKHATSMPVIASLNGYYSSGWIRYARLIEAAGADALELNIYYLATKPTITGAEVEQMYVDLVRDIKQSIRIPIAVKLNPYFSAVANISRRLVGAGARGLVLFNRFYQPDFDIENRAIVPSLDLSTPSELRLRLRWAAILCGTIKADIAITGGVHTAEDVIKSMMAGANVAMMTSALLKHGIDHIKGILHGMEYWMDSHEYESIKQMQGSMSHRKCSEPAAFERANYMKVLTYYKAETPSPLK